jgi:uncharacterized membrane protein YhaH (DUF805 family)
VEPVSGPASTPDELTWRQLVTPHIGNANRTDYFTGHLILLFVGMLPALAVDPIDNLSVIAGLVWICAMWVLASIAMGNLAVKRFRDIGLMGELGALVFGAGCLADLLALFDPALGPIALGMGLLRITTMLLLTVVPSRH